MGSNYRIIPVGGGGGTAPTGTLNVTENGTYSVIGYKYVNVDFYSGLDYLCFEAKEANSTIAMSNYGTNSPSISYSTDRRHWSSWDYSTILLSNVGDKVYMKGNNENGVCQGDNNYSKFTMTGRIAASGDVMTLLNDDPIPTSIPVRYCFYKLFENCTSLISAPYISATSKDSTSMFSMYGNECAYMFKGCTGLTSIPQFPAILATGKNYSMTFEGMYMNCTGLTGTLDLSYMTSPYDFTCEYDGIFKGTNYNYIDLTGLETATTNYAMKRAFQSMPLLETVDMRNVTTISGNYTLEGAFDQYNISTPTVNKVICGATNTVSETSIFNWLGTVCAVGDFFNLGGGNYQSGASGIPSGWTVHTSL